MFSCIGTEGFKGSLFRNGLTIGTEPSVPIVNYMYLEMGGSNGFMLRN